MDASTYTAHILHAHRAAELQCELRMREVHRERRAHRDIGQAAPAAHASAADYALAGPAQ